MSKRRKHKKLFGRMSIISIVMIIAISAMGVGYAAWSDGLNINTTMKTGNHNPELYIGDLEYDGLDYILSDDNRILSIRGEVYPGFNRDALIEVKNTGTVPTLLKKIDELDTSNIANFGVQSSNGYNRRSFFMQDTDVVETFQVNIRANESNENIMGLSTNYYFQTVSNDGQDEIAFILNEIDRTKEEISNVQNEIDRLKNLREEHSFKYNLNFQQGL